MLTPSLKILQMLCGHLLLFITYCKHHDYSQHPDVVSLVSQITGNINAGVGMIAVLFVAGIILFRKSVSLCNTEKGEEVYPAPEMPQRSSI